MKRKKKKKIKVKLVGDESFGNKNNSNNNKFGDTPSNYYRIKIERRDKDERRHYSHYLYLLKREIQPPLFKNFSLHFSQRGSMILCTRYVIERIVANRICVKGSDICGTMTGSINANNGGAMLIENSQMSL